MKKMYLFFLAIFFIANTCTSSLQTNSWYTLFFRRVQTAKNPEIDQHFNTFVSLVNEMPDEDVLFKKYGKEYAAYLLLFKRIARNGCIEDPLFKDDMKFIERSFEWRKNKITKQ